MSAKKELAVLAVETSCDETAAAVVADGRRVLSNCVYTQDIHRRYGGVVPEIASRKHVVKLPYIVDEAVERSGLDVPEIDAFAVTCGPGLVGALLTGVSFMKAYAYALNKPLVPVNHIEGHICANYLTYPDLRPPYVCLVVSGGHTALAYVSDYGRYECLGTTRDDAAGEAVDKIARVLGLPYPGGPALERLAAQGDKNAYAFPRSFAKETHLDFSFSGLKTAVVNTLHAMDQRGERYARADVAASFQESVVQALADNAFEALRRRGAKKIALCGGVSANGALREEFARRAQAHGASLFVPEIQYCTDNAAMIASAAYFGYLAGETAGLDLNAYPSLGLF